MDDVRDPDLYQRTQQLLEPGEIELDGLIVHTDLSSDADIEMLDATLAVGDVIAIEPTLDDVAAQYGTADGAIDQASNPVYHDR
jgi:hypothetical protein